MKRLLIILGIGVLGTSILNAQDISPEASNQGQVLEREYEFEQEGKEFSYESEKLIKDGEGYTSINTEVEHSKEKPGTMIGNFVGTLGHGAKEVGKGVKNASSWTFDKVKHNKLTKNLFNQPSEQQDEMSSADSESNIIGTVGHGAKEVGKGAKNASSWTFDKVKHNKLTKNLFGQPAEQQDEMTSANSETKAEEKLESAAVNTEEALEDTGDAIEKGAEKVGSETKDAYKKSKEEIDEEF